MSKQAHFEKSQGLGLWFLARTAVHSTSSSIGKYLLPPDKKSKSRPPCRVADNCCVYVLMGDRACRERFKRPDIRKLQREWKTWFMSAAGRWIRSQQTWGCVQGIKQSSSYLLVAVFKCSQTFKSKEEWNPSREETTQTKGHLEQIPKGISRYLFVMQQAIVRCFSPLHRTQISSHKEVLLFQGHLIAPVPNLQYNPAGQMQFLS